jgi:hypothetical protein
MPTTSDTQTRLTLEWHTRNTLPLSNYAPQSHFKAWWKCTTCSHEWQATIGNRRSKNSNCPQCRILTNRGNNNPAWKGHGEISGREWCGIERQAGKAPFNISIEFAWQLFLEQNRQCAVSGKPLNLSGKVNGKYSGTAALDRIDYSKGFTEDNVHWLHKTIQSVKRNLPEHEFIRICEDVAIHQSKKRLGSIVPSFKQWTDAAASHST